MIDQSSIPGMVDALGEEEAGAVVAMLPEGDAASGVVAQLAEEAERRIMADLSRAIRTCGALVEIAQGRAGPAVLARVRRVHAQALAYANRFAEALDSLEAALAEAGRGHDPVEVGRIRLTMLHVYARQAKFDDAASCGELARDAFETANQRELVGRAENNLGIIERMRDRPAAAIEHFERAAAELRAQPPLLAHVENNRAEALLDLDRFAGAEDAFRAALAAFRAAGAHRHAGIVLGNLADLASRQGRLHEALAMFEEARRVLDDASSPGDAARLAVEHADVLQTLGMLDPAVKAYQDAIPVLAEHRMAAESARAHLGLGKSLAAMGRAEAQAALQRARELYDQLQSDSGRAKSLAMTADVAAAAGHLSQAATLLAQARGVVADRPAAGAWIDLILAGVQLRQGRSADAAETARGAAEVAESLGVAPLAADLRQVSGRALMSQALPADAAGQFRLAVRHAERCRGMLQTERFRSAFLGERASIWEDCTTAVLDAGAPDALDEAFSFVEMAKSRSLLDVLAGGAVKETIAARGAAHSALIAELKELTGELGALYARAHEGADSTPESRARTRAEIQRREAAAEALLIRLGAVSGFAGSFAAATPLPQLAAMIPDDGALVEYFAEAGWLSAFVVKRSGAAVRRRLAPLTLVTERLGGLLFQIGRAASRGLPGGERGVRLRADAESELAAIAELVISPLRDAICETQRLVLVPTAPLHNVPFPALPMDGKALFELAEIGVVPSASVLAHLPPPATGPALVVGVSDANAPRAEAEALAAAASIPGALVLTGPAATREEFVRRCEGRSHVHVAGHARFIASNPDASGLLLADGWLTAAEISRLPLRGASVLLSGCETGRARIGGGDEIMGLTRAVLSAGARSVTTTLWPVHDESTWTLVSRACGLLYAGARDSTNPADRRIATALRAAQREMDRGGAHPAAWAPFITACAPW